MERRVSYFYPLVDMQVLATLCISLTAIRLGANLAMTSAVLYEFEKDSDEFLKMTMEEATWLRKNTHLLIIGIR